MNSKQIIININIYIFIIIMNIKNCQHQSDGKNKNGKYRPINTKYTSQKKKRNTRILLYFFNGQFTEP